MSYMTAFHSFDPYSNAGSQAVNTYSKLNNQYATNPIGTYNEMMKSFALSPSQQYQLQQGEKAINQNNALKGWAGSGQSAKDLEDYARNTTDAFQQQYLNNILGIGNTGLSGLGNLSNLGYQSTLSQAQLQEAMDQINAMQHNSWLNDIFGLAGTGIGAAFSDPGISFLSKILGL